MYYQTMSIPSHIFLYILPIQLQNSTFLCYFPSYFLQPIIQMSLDYLIKFIELANNTDSGQTTIKYTIKNKTQ